MRRMLPWGKTLFFLFILLLLFGCSYNMANRPRSPREAVDCSKFATEYNQEERRRCTGD